MNDLRKRATDHAAGKFTAADLGWMKSKGEVPEIWIASARERLAAADAVVAAGLPELEQDVLEGKSVHAAMREHAAEKRRQVVSAVCDLLRQMPGTGRVLQYRGAEYDAGWGVVSRKPDMWGWTETAARLIEISGADSREIKNEMGINE